MEQNKLPNGGFPPIVECLFKENKNIKKERYLSSNIKNINIHKILNTKKQKKIITDDHSFENNDLEEV
jgi:hypothetical protein